MDNTDEIRTAIVDTTAQQSTAQRNAAQRSTAHHNAPQRSNAEFLM
jgi:hypothetical protein